MHDSSACLFLVKSVAGFPDFTPRQGHETRPAREKNPLAALTGDLIQSGRSTALLILPVNLTLRIQNRHSQREHSLSSFSIQDIERDPMAAGRVPQRKSTAGQAKGPVETEILTVHVEREGQHVSAKWGLNPTLKEELTPEEWKEVTDSMGKVTDIVRKRFSDMLTQKPEEGGTA